MLILRQREFVKKKKQNRKLLRAAENEVMHANRAAKKALKAQKALERGNINEAEQLQKSAEKAVQSARMDGGRLEQMATKISKTRPSALSNKGLNIREVGVKEANVSVSPRSKAVSVEATFGRNPTTGLFHRVNSNNIHATNLKSNNRLVMSTMQSTGHSPNVWVLEDNAGTVKRLVFSGDTRKAIGNSTAAVHSPGPVVSSPKALPQPSKPTLNVNALTGSGREVLSKPKALPGPTFNVTPSKPVVNVHRDLKPPVIKTESKLSRLAKNKYAQAGAGLLALGGIGYGVHRYIKNKNKGEEDQLENNSND